MKILVIADVHGQFEKLSKILDIVGKKKFDLVICPGDFTDMFGLPTGFTQMNVADMVIQKIISLNSPTFCVPGNHDPYEILEVFNEYDVNLHNKTKGFGGLDFIGFGGAATPFNTVFEPSEEETKEALENLAKNIKNNLVLVVHNPPKNTKVDMTFSGNHVGSQTIRDFILEKKPILTLSAHIHEAGGIDKLGETTLFYPGPVFEGCYGIVEVEGKQVKCEIKKVIL